MKLGKYVGKALEEEICDDIDLRLYFIYEKFSVSPWDTVMYHPLSTAVGNVSFRILIATSDKRFATGWAWN